MRIVSLDAIYFDAQLPESQVEHVRVGQPVSISVDAAAGRTFRGTVSEIYPVASSTARSFTVRIAIRNEGNALRPQMFARGRIILARHEHAIVVPRDAVLDYTGTTGRVFVAKNGKAVAQGVKCGFTQDAQIEIISGLKRGDLVVTVGQSQIQPGDAIEVNGPSDTAEAHNAAP
jgi:RND family efflux transporter MFP subunit